MLLDYRPISGSHTSENIYDTFSTIVDSEWGIHNSKFCITLDNASNNSGFIERLGDAEQKDNTMDNSGSNEELAKNIWDKGAILDALHMFLTLLLKLLLNN
jgi:hypothetical protein